MSRRGGGRLAGDLDALAGRVVRCLDEVPEDVPAGRTCAMATPGTTLQASESLALQVPMINAVGERARRPVSWFSITVPQTERDRAYFAPPADLRVGGVPELLFLARALPPGRPGRRHDRGAGTAHRRALGGGEWGICNECGMGRVERAQVPAMLDYHREILTRFGA